MVSSEIRHGQLARLAETLRDIVRVVGEDPGCSWRGAVEAAAARADLLLEHGFTQEQVTELSSSVCSLYDASRRLPGYNAPDHLPGASNLQTYASVAYERALEIRAVGHAKV